MYTLTVLHEPAYTSTYSQVPVRCIVYSYVIRNLYQALPGEEFGDLVVYALCLTPVLGHLLYQVEYLGLKYGFIAQSFIFTKFCYCTKF